MPVVVSSLAPVLANRKGLDVDATNAALHLRPLQSSLVWLTLLSKKYKVRLGGAHTPQ